MKVKPRTVCISKSTCNRAENCFRPIFWNLLVILILVRGICFMKMVQFRISVCVGLGIWL